MSKKKKNWLFIFIRNICDNIYKKKNWLFIFIRNICDNIYKKKKRLYLYKLFFIKFLVIIKEIIFIKI